ncbi:MAG: methyltransferase [Candidatus Thorarchaeota archaeon]|nr:MAG: methyltransferase [Candidatus Thorarchaeota archaeon]
MVENNTAPLEPELIRKIAMDANPAFAMLAGINLDLFTMLKGKTMSTQQMADALDVQTDKLEPLLYALVTAGLLSLDDKNFSNTIETAHYLIPDSSSFVGDHPYLNPLILSWNFLAALKTAETIRAGEPQVPYDFSSRSEEELTQDFKMTQPIALRAGRELVAKYDFSSFRTLVDLGGGPGGLSIAVTEQLPHIQATVVDQPSVTPIAQRFIEEAGAADRVRVKTVDVVTAQLTGSYDVAVLRALIQVLKPDQALLALKNVSSIVKPGGVIYILGHILDDSRISPPEEVWHKLSSINYYDVPAPYTEEEHRRWLTEAGFVRIRRDRLPNSDGVMIAQKPAVALED